MKNSDLFFGNRRLSLSSGADLYCINTDEYKRSRLDLFFTFPADKRISPLIRLLLSVLFRGSKNFPSITHMNKHLDAMYDSTVYWKDYHIGANHTYRISCTMLDRKYLPADDRHLDLLGETLKVVQDVLLEPLYDKDGLLSKKFFESERDFAIDNIKSKLSTPKSYAAIKCTKMLFGDDPAGYSLDGTEELLRSFTRKDLTEIRKYFLECATVSAYYVGTDSAEEIAHKLAPLFEGIGERRPAALIPVYALEGNEYVEEEESFDLTQGVLRVGMTCDTVIGDNDSAALAIYNDILGGSSTSKLFMNVREKLSLCYYCHSGIDNTCGIMAIACGIKPENKDVALSQIKYQIEQMRQGNISDDEIEVAKKGLLNSLNQVTDSSSSLITSSFKYNLLAGRDVSIEERRQSIMNATKEDIVAIAQKINVRAVFFLNSNKKNGEISTEDSDNE